MAQEEPKQPDYKGSIEIAAWKKTDKNGKTYLSVKIGQYANLFKNEPKEKKQEDI